QIGLARILGAERYKGGTRVSFSAGPRARRELLAESAVLRDIGRALQTPPLEAKLGVERLRDQLDAARRELGQARASLARSIAERARDEKGVVRVVVDEGGLEMVRQVTAELTREGDRLVIVAGPVEGGVHVLVSRGPGSSADARAVLAQIASATGGRGGGR